jgi:hypothetical protein
LFDALADNPDREEIISTLFELQPGAADTYLSLYEMAADLLPIEWIWRNWIPRHMVTLLGAVPGAGKSLVGLDLCKRIIHGSGFPDGTPVPNPGRPVIYVDAEAVPQLINERAQSWQMDTSKIYLMDPPPDGMIDFVRADDRARLIEMAHTLNPELIVIDSLSTVSSRGENSIEDVRDLLGFFGNLAREYALGLVLIHHLRKGGQAAKQSSLFTRVTIDDFRGSGHIVAMARSVLGLSVVQTGPAPDPNGPRRLEVVKTNLCRHPQPIGVELVDLHPTGVALQWGEAPETWQEPTKLDECVEWLEDLLRNAAEPMQPKQVVKEGKHAGFGRAMVYRARNELAESIESTAGRRNPNSRWKWVESTS